LKLVTGFLDRGAKRVVWRERRGGHGDLAAGNVHLDAAHPGQLGEFLPNRASAVVARHPA